LLSVLKGTESLASSPTHSSGGLVPVDLRTALQSPAGM
jgi:hypothetical protein